LVMLFTFDNLMVVGEVQTVSIAYMLQHVTWGSFQGDFEWKKNQITKGFSHPGLIVEIWQRTSGFMILILNVFQKLELGVINKITLGFLGVKNIKVPY
jgi:hypothetical protein